MLEEAMCSMGIRDEDLGESRGEIPGIGGEGFAMAGNLID